jgi:hypothetical protein
MDYDFMATRNQRVADRHYHLGKFNVRNTTVGELVTVACLSFPIDRLDLPSDIGERATRLAEQFRQQVSFLPKNI